MVTLKASKGKKHNSKSMENSAHRDGLKVQASPYLNMNRNIFAETDNHRNAGNTNYNVVTYFERSTKRAENATYDYDQNSKMLVEVIEQIKSNKGQLKAIKQHTPK